jgi:low affinity Fe/Cu permease
MEEHFRKLAQYISKTTGSAKTFFTAILIVLLWALSGPLLDYSTTWQLMINTVTTIVTFLMVFLIQNTQNRDNKTLHVKLDELLRAMKGTRNKLLDTDELSDEELEELHQDFVKRAQRYQTAIEKRNKTKKANGTNGKNGSS